MEMEADVGAMTTQVQPPGLARAPLVFPIRVIDVGETVGSRHGNVVFTKPTSWEFHTISHTWSKGVQSWSNLIARKMTGQSTGAEAEATYNDLFRREDFHWHECYAPFTEFLQLMRADGVEQVWLDALCINQESESGEKSQELQNMGSYYANSLGCYVCVHGFGEGFEMWKKGATDLVIPRWFNRVWTFQEMLLPKTITFILDIHPVVRLGLNQCISLQEAQGVVGPCKCVISSPMFKEDFLKEVLEFWRRKDKQRVIEIRCGNSPCCKCGGVDLIRRAKDIQLLEQQSPEGMAPDLYFVDRQCIVQLMKMAGDQLTKLLYHSESYLDDDNEIHLERLKSLMKQWDDDEEMRHRLRMQEGAGDLIYHGWDPIRVVLEVSSRDCSHDEDRILSILGLLNLEGAVQLRAGKTLDGQLVDMAQQLLRANYPTMLLKLCALQLAGHTRPGMSWAPSLGVEGGFQVIGEARRSAMVDISHTDTDFTYSEMHKSTQVCLRILGSFMSHFTGSVQVKSVMDDGSLLLCGARVLWECSFDRVHEHMFDLHVTARNCPPIRFKFEAYFTPSSCLLYYMVYAGAAKRGINPLPLYCLVRLEGTHLEDRLHSFQVCLVLLGRLVQNTNQIYEVIMVCVGNKEEGLLHKVGLGWLPRLKEEFSLIEPTPLCTLGGFEDYMTRFVFSAPPQTTSPKGPG